MSNRSHDYREAIQDFIEARQQAGMQAVMARFTGKSSELLSYEEVAQKLRLTPGSELGRRDIPLDAIVGSVGRYTDFNRTFLPLHNRSQARWTSVKTAMEGLTGVPPIEVYQVGEVYFVRDGNHRVSVARQAGATHIEANVIEVHTKVPLTPDVEPDDLIVKAEYADFLEQTCLTEICPGADLSVTAPGQYTRLREHIQMHHYFMGLNEQRDVPYAEAVQHWYTEVYQPLALAIEEQGLLRGFPGRTTTDLYLWVAEHRSVLEKELGWEIRPDAAVSDLAASQNATDGEMRAVGGWRKTRLTDRYTDRLFLDLLVPLSGEPESWHALAQALALAQREAAHVHGLHIVATEAQKTSPEALAVQAAFEQACAQAGVPGHLAIEPGEVARKICERARLTDLVVLHVAHPPAGGLASLGSGWRTIIWRCARPVLAVAGAPQPMDRALLAFDGGSKSKEALFVATYLAERWQTALTVLAVGDGSRVTASVLDQARRYLDLHEVPADYELASGPVTETIFKTAEARQSNLLMLGGYGANPVKEVILGSTVNRVLRETPCPVFICR